MVTNAALPEISKIVNGLSNTAPSTSTPAYVSMKGYNRLSVLVSAKNGSTVTGSAITLKQATAIAGTSEKALPFTTYWANVDAAASDALVATTAASNTFTTNTTNSKLLVYVLEVRASDLDVANGFDCVRAGTADAVNSTLTVTYILREPRFADATPLPSAVVD